MHGCATASYQARPPQPAAPSPNRVAAAEAAVDAARRNGATQFAASAQHLHVAEAELTAGKQALQAQDGERAGWALARAEADADLSQAAARQARQESDARAVEGQLAAARAGRPQAPSSPADPFEEAPPASTPRAPSLPERAPAAPSLPERAPAAPSLPERAPATPSLPERAPKSTPPPPGQGGVSAPVPEKKTPLLPGKALLPPDKAPLAPETAPLLPGKGPALPDFARRFLGSLLSSLSR